MPVYLRSDGKYLITVSSNRTQTGFEKHEIELRFLKEALRHGIPLEGESSPPLEKDNQWPPADIGDWKEEGDTYVCVSPRNRYKAVIARSLKTGELAFKFEGRDWMNKYGKHYEIKEIIEIIRKEYRREMVENG